MFGVAVGRRVLCDGGCGAGEGRALNEPMLKSGAAARDQLGGIFRPRPRAAALRRSARPDRCQTSFPTSGDPGTDRMLEIIAREQPIRPAAVLIPVVDHPRADRAADAALGASQRSCRPDRLSRRQDRCDRCVAARCGAARGRGGGRARPRIHRSDRLSRSLWHRLRISHPADGGAGEARLQAAHQRMPKSTTPSRCRWRS